MLDSLAARIGKYPICNNVISKDDFPVYKFGINQADVCSFIVCFLSHITSNNRMPAYSTYLHSIRFYVVIVHVNLAL